jgi:hypothetical protein
MNSNSDPGNAIEFSLNSHKIFELIEIMDEWSYTNPLRFNKGIFLSQRERRGFVFDFSLIRFQMLLLIIEDYGLLVHPEFKEGDRAFIDFLLNSIFEPHIKVKVVLRDAADLGSIICVNNFTIPTTEISTQCLRFVSKYWPGKDLNSKLARVLTSHGVQRYSLAAISYQIPICLKFSDY